VTRAIKEQESSNKGVGWGQYSSWKGAMREWEGSNKKQEGNNKGVGREQYSSWKGAMREWEGSNKKWEGSNNGVGREQLVTIHMSWQRHWFTYRLV
jgi:hypothetical protein